MDNKLKMQTTNLTDENFDALATMFPNAVTETVDEDGVVVRAVDADVLRQEINTFVVSGKEERYQFTWPDKKKSVLLANAPIAATLRPVRNDEPATIKDENGEVIREYTRSGSVNFDTTENLYIEGDNLDVLKLLRETYLNRVKMIYIDPPYNTGNDFVYEDDFAGETEEFLRRDGQYDDNGNRMVKNLDSNGRFHTDWLNMIYPRLRVARDLLTDDGVIFISIDDNEVENLKKICSEVFGEQNFIAELVWERAYSPKNDAKYISNSHDYVLMFVKSLDNFKIGRLKRTKEADARYNNPDNDPRGVWKPSDMSVKTYNAESDYPITLPSGRVIEPPTGRCWSLSKNAFFERLQDNRIYFGADGNSVPQIKRFLTELKFDGMAPQSIMFYKDVGHSQEGAKEVTALLEAGAFDGPKPVRLLRRLLTLANLKDDSIVLDFFSGSATTAHAIMQLNAEDGGKRKFIMVQLPEATDEKSEAYKAGYANICEIGKERIRRAAKLIEDDYIKGSKAPLQTHVNKGGKIEPFEAIAFWKDGQENTEQTERMMQELDFGFRVLKLDSSNMKEVYYTPQEYAQTEFSFDGLVDNIKSDRTAEDLLFQVMLDLGVPLSSSIEVKDLDGKSTYYVNDGYLIACFESVSDDIVTAIAKDKPYYAVFRDNSFASDSTLVNYDQIFKTYSPSTQRRVL